MEGIWARSNSWVREDDMDADELIEKFLTEHIDLIATDRPDATIIITAERPDGEHWGPREGWQYLIRPADSPQYGPAAETWYYEHELHNTPSSSTNTGTSTGKKSTWNGMAEKEA